MSQRGFAKHSLAHTPTPLEPLEWLSRELDSPPIFIKRDDCTGLAFGGNKTRKLEYLLGDALAQNCDRILTAGGRQSNHARQTAAAARKAGIPCELFLENVSGTPHDFYRTSGNVLLDRLFEAEIHSVPSGTDLDAAMAERCEELIAKGGRPYPIPVGGSNGLGALGYVDCARELVNHLHERGINSATIITATGSGGTQAGLIAGLAKTGSNAEVLGINVSASEEIQRAKVYSVLADCCALLKIQTPDDSSIRCNDQYYLPGYGVPNEGTLAAIRRLAKTEGLLLDPVYTGKAMAGLIDLATKGILSSTDAIVFLHTGGQAALFAYESILFGDDD